MLLLNDDIASVRAQRLICTALLTFLLFCLGWSADAESPKRAVVAAGPDDGVYMAFSRCLAGFLAKEFVPVQVVSTGGSVENVKLLETGRADFAVVQSDVASKAIAGDLPFDKPASRVRFVSSLYTEAVHIFARSGLYIPSSSHLSGKIISLGPLGSGTIETARVVLEASGISLREVDARYLPLDQTTQELRAQSIDAAFLMGPVPSAPAWSLLQRQNARLVPLEAQLIDRLLKQPGYVETVIPGLTYAKQSDSVPTIGVRTLLLARDDADQAVGQAIRRIIGERDEEIGRAAGIRLDLSPSSIGTHLAIPPHSMVKGGIESRLLSWFGTFVGSLLIVALLVGLFLKRHLARLLLVSHHVVIRLLLIPASILALGSFGMFVFEHHVNENFKTLPGSAWSIIVYVAGGFQSRAPLTRGGETVAILIVILGVALVGWVTAELAAHMLKSEIGKVLQYLTGRRLMPGSIQKHIVIVNWDRRAAAIIRQLHGADFAERLPVVVISETKFEVPNESEFERVIPHIGEIDEVSLRRACVEKAHSITLLSSWNSEDRDGVRPHTGPDVADSKTIMLILLIRGLSTVPITAEIIAARNVPAAKLAGHGGPLEIVCAERYSTEFLAQCAVTPGLAAVYDDLLTFGPNTSEIYKIRVPVALRGKHFADAIEHFTEGRRQAKEPIIPIGVYRALSAHLNPTEGELGELLPSDEIIVIADHQPQL